MALEAFNAALAKQLELREATNRNLEESISQGMFSLSDGAFGSRSKASLEQEKQGVVASVQQSIAEAMQSGDDAKVFEAIKMGSLTLQSVDPDSATQLMKWYEQFKPATVDNSATLTDYEGLGDTIGLHLSTTEMVNNYMKSVYSEDDLAKIKEYPVADRLKYEKSSRDAIEASINTFVFWLQKKYPNINQSDILTLVNSDAWMNYYKEWAGTLGNDSLVKFSTYLYPSVTPPKDNSLKTDPKYEAPPKIKPSSAGSKARSKEHLKNRSISQITVSPHEEDVVSLFGGVPRSKIYLKNK